MKNNVKIILMMLCIGVSANIMGMKKMYRPDIMNALNNYRPASDNSKEGAVTAMAQAWAEPLSDAERVALIYECYTLAPNAGANNDWSTRTASNLVSAYTQRAKNLGSSFWKWATYEAPANVISGVTGKISSWTAPVTSKIKGGASYASSFIWTPLPRVDEYIKNNKNINEGWYTDVVELAQEDFEDPEVIPLLTASQRPRRNFDARLDLLVNKIMPVIERSTPRGVTPPSRGQVQTRIMNKWLPLLPQPQQLQRQFPQQVWTAQQKAQMEYQKGLAQQQPRGWFSNWGWNQQPTQPQQQPVQPQQQLVPVYQQNQPQQPQQQPQQQQLVQGNSDLSQKLTINSAILNADQKKWINDFIAWKQATGTAKDTAKHQLLNDKIIIGYPKGMLIPKSQKIHAAAIKDSVTDYFDSQWR